MRGLRTVLADAWRLLRQHGLHALPVLDKAQRVVGMVGQNDFLHHAGLDDYQTLGERLRVRLQLLLAVAQGEVDGHASHPLSRGLFLERESNRDPIGRRALGSRAGRSLSTTWSTVSIMPPARGPA